jgi:hypothetical protein
MCPHLKQECIERIRMLRESCDIKINRNSIGSNQSDRINNSISRSKPSSVKDKTIYLTGFLILAFLAILCLYIFFQQLSSSAKNPEGYLFFGILFSVFALVSLIYSLKELKEFV